MPELTLIIKVDPATGQMAIAGSPEMLGNHILAFGTLEMAKVAMLKQAEASQNRVQPVSMMPPPFPGTN